MYMMMTGSQVRYCEPSSLLLVIRVMTISLVLADSRGNTRQAAGTFGGEVKGRRCAPCLVTPVDGALAVGVLVVVEHAVSVLTGVPVLPKGHQGNRAVDVLPHRLASCTPPSQCQRSVLLSLTRIRHSHWHASCRFHHHQFLAFIL